MSQIQTWRRRVMEDPSAAMPLALWFGLLFADLVVCSRWLSGAMTVPLTAPLAWGSTAVITAVSVAALVSWRQQSRPPVSSKDWLPEAVTLVIPFLWMGVIGWGTTPFTWGGLFALWGMLLASVGLVSQWVTASEQHSSLNDLNRELPDSIDHGTPATHWQKRVTLPEGDLIEGGAVVEFSAGQKEAVLHLSFCPPLSFLPEIHTEVTGDEDLEIKTEAAHTFGARLSVRRRVGVETAATCDISYAAVPPETNEAAA